MATAYGQTAKGLLQSLVGSDWMPAFDEEGVRKVLAEMNELYTMILDTMEGEEGQVTDHAIACGLLVQHETVNRNKRCLMAYFEHRMEKLSALRWDTGIVIPAHVKPLLSASEVEFFRKYQSEALNAYMNEPSKDTISLDSIGLDLTQDLQPPKDLFVEVLVKEDCGEIMTDTGPLRLEKHSRHFVRRVQVAHLIRQGKLQQC